MGDNDSYGILPDHHILDTYGCMPPTSIGLCLQMHKGEEINMKMVDDTPLHDSYDTMQLLRKITACCHKCRDLELDYEPYIDRAELMIILKQFECVLENKDKVKRL